VEILDFCASLLFRSSGILTFAIFRDATRGTPDGSARSDSVGRTALIDAESASLFVQGRDSKDSAFQAGSLRTIFHFR
jgi:hypothetical protein